MITEEIEDPLDVCRDDGCSREDLHPAHPVKTRRKRELDTPLREAGERPPWTKCCRKALDAIIEAKMSDRIPKRSSEIYEDVKNDYGQISKRADSGHRTLRYHLNHLARKGRILRIDLGDQMFVYLRVGSKLAHDISSLRDFVSDSLTIEGPNGAHAVGHNA